MAEYKICNECGSKVKTEANFCQNCKSTSFREYNSGSSLKSVSSAVSTVNYASQSDAVYKLFYWNNQGKYIISKTKLVSIGVFLFFALGIFTGAPAIIILFGAMCAGFTLMLGFGIHKILKNDIKKPFDNNDMGLIEDFKHLLLFWQDKNGQFVLSKTKIITCLVFLLFVIGVLVSPTGNINVAILVGLFFAVPAFVIGYAIHKITFKDTPVKRVETVKTESKTVKTAPSKMIDEEIKQDKPISGEMKQYKNKFETLKKDFDVKERDTRKLIEKRFQPPQMTYTRFIAVVDKSKDIFTKQYGSAIDIINLSTESNDKITSQLDSKIDILKSLTDKLDDLNSELVVNIGKSETDEVDLDGFLEDMDELIGSVKNYE